MLGEEVGRSTPGNGNDGEHRPSSQKSRHLQAQQTSATRLQHAGRACLGTRRQRTGTAMRAESSGEPGKGCKRAEVCQSCPPSCRMKDKSTGGVWSRETLEDSSCRCNQAGEGAS